MNQEKATSILSSLLNTLHFSSASLTYFCCEIYNNIQLEATLLPFSILSLSTMQQIAMVTSLLHQVLEIHFDFTSDFASSKLTADKSKKTFHQDIDPSPQKPPLGGFLCLQPLSVLPLTHSCSYSKSTALSARMI